jgi:hypothetical protein
MGDEIREPSQIPCCKDFTLTVPTSPLAPAHTASVPDMCTLQAFTSLPAQQGRTGQTLGLCCDWHTTRQCADCQDLGNNKEPGSGLGPGPGSELPPTHPLTTNSLLGTAHLHPTSRALAPRLVSWPPRRNNQQSGRRQVSGKGSTPVPRAQDAALTAGPGPSPG